DPTADPEMKPRNIKERMSAADAVKCFTVNSAYALHEEKNAGTLEAGKDADFVVFDADFTDDAVMADPKICGITPKALYINGEKIY
ncbi:MAG: amidohydrolase family protein, partial [Lachnospiraceae bacterium]|nr:amidohydrolase family protein [Candidatus Hippenecus merdae]